MGYDFILFRMRQKVASCPARIPADFGKDAVVPIEDPAPLHDAVRASPLFEADQMSFEGPRLVWHTPDGGSLDVKVMAQGVNIDTHAHWDHVAQLFDLALGVWPDTALFDLQAAQVHDPASFRAFVERTYRDQPESRQADPKDAGG
jgi:hypothetical protein